MAFAISKKATHLAPNPLFIARKEKNEQVLIILFMQQKTEEFYYKFFGFNLSVMFVSYALNVLNEDSTFLEITFLTASISVEIAFSSVSSCFNFNSNCLSCC